jgi:energy-coupling factor transport system permease protein
LFRLPESWPLIGGPITGEAVFYGVLNGVSLGGILAAFAALNQALPVRSLVRLIPRAFYPVAVVTAIAVTFVPTTLRQYHQIREAQAVRGHRLSGWRDWLPLLLPLLIGGLERALQLAEAMVARGFASPAEESLSLGVRAGLGLGLLSFGGGWLLRLVWGVSLWGWLGLVLGAGLIGLSLWQAGRRVPRTTYRPTRWTSADTLVAGAAFLAVAGFLWPWLNRASIFYYPYPRLIWPEVHPVLVLATLGLLGPVGWLVFEPYKTHLRAYK